MESYILWKSLNCSFVVTSRFHSEIYKKKTKNPELSFAVDLDQKEFFSLAGFVLSRYYISLVDVAQNVIVIISNYVYSRLLMILFSNKWCLFKVVFFWKNMLVVLYSWILHPSFTRTIYKNFKSVFYLSSVNENL